jgi:CBS domain-containing protein
MDSHVGLAHPEETAAAARARMRRDGRDYLVVTDHHKVVGVLGRRDLEETDGLTVAERMQPVKVAAKVDSTARQAAALLRGRAVGLLPVLRGTKVIGVIAARDLLDRLGRTTPHRRALEHPGKPLRRSDSPRRPRR